MRPEIFGSLNDAHPKELLPVVIDDNSAREGMIGIDQPFGQIQAIFMLTCVSRKKC